MAQSPSKAPPNGLRTSPQYDLFTSFFGDPQNLSNTIDLWDAIPKYAVAARQQTAMRSEHGHLPIHTDDFEYTSPALDRPAQCSIKIRPALIEVEPGKEVHFYPAQSEEIIEEVLKKIFTDQQYGMHSAKTGESWVSFTLGMLRRELRKRGHTRSLDEIKRSLEIMSSTVIEVELKGRGRVVVYSNTILSNMTRTKRADIEDDPGAKWAVQLPALISQSINELSYRQFNYALHMRLKTQLARWMHKRLVHRYRNASILDAYRFAFTSVERDSGLLNNVRISANVRALEKALDELQAEGILYSVESEKRFEGKRLVDVIFTVFATSEFTAEVKAASARLSEGKLRLGHAR